MTDSTANDRPGVDGRAVAFRLHYRFVPVPYKHLRWNSF